MFMVKSDLLRETTFFILIESEKYPVVERKMFKILILVDRFKVFYRFKKLNRFQKPEQTLTTVNAMTNINL